MVLRSLFVSAALVLSGLSPTIAATAEPVPIVVFPFELVDTSLDGQMLGTTDAEKARLELLAPRLREAYVTSGQYRAVPLGAREKDARAQNLQACGGCDVKIARELGGKLSVTGTVQKVSNLILNVNVYVRDTETGKVVSAGSADIRSNTDESWLRGLDWLLKHRLLGAR